MLLAATDTGRKEYARAREALDEWPVMGTALCTRGRILREYLPVATRPVERNGLGLSRVDSVANARALCGRLRLLDETEKVSTRLLALLDDISCGGKQVHDANIVATILVHGVDTLVTINSGDFVRFEELVRVRGL